MEPTQLDPTRTVLENGRKPTDFSNSRTLEDILREVKRMAARSEALPTSDGQVKFSAQELASRIEKAAKLAVRATRDPRDPFVTKYPSPDALDELFANSGITSTAGLREALVRVMHKRENISGEVSALVREIRTEGEFHPIWKVPEDRFMREHPKESVPQEVTEGTSDLEGQVFLRWQEIDREQQRAGTEKRNQQIRDWNDARAKVMFQQDWITPPASADGYKQYGRAQEANRTQREAKEAAGRGKRGARIEGVGNKDSISADIGRMLGADGATFTYEGINYARGDGRSPEPKMTRTYTLPIEGAPGHVLTMTLFSEAEIPDRGLPRELPEHFQGVMVESIDQLRAYAGEKTQTPEQRNVVELARAQMQKVEAQVRGKYGIDLGVDRKLAVLVS